MTSDVPIIIYDEHRFFHHAIFKPMAQAYFSIFLLENLAENCDLVQKKCIRALNMVKFLRGTWWGADPRTLLLLYKSFVRSIIDYGSFMYFPTQKIILKN